MLTKTKGIVLRIIPYKENQMIVHVYTLHHGRVAYIAARQRGKKSTLSKALSIPLAVLDMEVEHFPKRELQKVREAKLAFPLNGTLCHPIKNTIALFLSEVLYRVVRDTEADERMFAYMERAFHILNTVEEGLANFHLTFLMGMSHYLGILPNIDSYTQESYFDMQNGCFTLTPPSHRLWLEKNESQVLHRLFRISFENMSLYAFSRKERQRMLEMIIIYYRLHLPEFGEIKSLEVTRTLFD